MLVAWIVVAALQAINEALDARDWINWTGSVNWSETTKDTIATLFWPTVLLLAWRRIGKSPSPGRVHLRTFQLTVLDDRLSYR